MNARYSTPTGPTRRAKSSVPSRMFEDSPARSQSSPAGAVSRTKGKRLVRKRTMLEKLAALPDNLITNWLEDLLMLDFTSLGYPAGLTLNGLHALVKLSSWAPSVRGFWRSAKLAEAEARVRSGYSWSWSLSMLLIGASIANAVYLFSQRRKYEMWQRRDPLASPSAKLVDADLFAPQKTLKEVLWDWLKSFVFTPTSTSEMGQVTQLSIWTPDDIYLRVFTLYSPCVAILWHFMRSGSALAYMFAMLCTVAQTWQLVRVYRQTLKDRLLLHSEVAMEYQEKFVRPRLFAYKKDAEVQTSQAEYVQMDTSYYDDTSFYEEAQSARKRSSINGRKR